MRIRFAASLRLAGLMASALVANGPSHAQASTTQPRFEPAPCAFAEVAADWGAQNRVDCGWLHVPESRGRVDSRMLRLWVAIARADAPPGQRAEPLAYVHGGPGFATVDYFFPYFPKSKTWAGMRKERDVVFMDQRGTGRSQPGLCPELKAPLEALELEKPPVAERRQRSDALYDACRERLRADGMDFGAYNTAATAADYEDLRVALGYPAWNLYGISYGTRVVLHALRAHPHGVRSAIVDSLFPTNSEHSAEQYTTTARGLEALQLACNAQPDCAKTYPDIVGQLAQASRWLDAEPVAVPGGRVRGADFVSALWTVMVSSAQAQWVPGLVYRAAARDAAFIRRFNAIHGGVPDFGDYRFAQARTVNCYEIHTGDLAPTIRAAAARYPWLVGDDLDPELENRNCAAWQTERAALSFYAPVGSDHPVLLMAGNLDPATPVSDAVLAARHLRNGYLVLVDGTSHAAMGRDECTRSIAHAFLRDPSRAPDTACLATRPAFVIPVDGVDGFLASTEEK